MKTIKMDLEFSGKNHSALLGAFDEAVRRSREMLERECYDNSACDRNDEGSFAGTCTDQGGKFEAEASDEGGWFDEAIGEDTPLAEAYAGE